VGIDWSPEIHPGMWYSVGKRPSITHTNATVGGYIFVKFSEYMNWQDYNIYVSTGGVNVSLDGIADFSGVNNLDGQAVGFTETLPLIPFSSGGIAKNTQRVLSNASSVNVGIDWSPEIHPGMWYSVGMVTPIT